MDERGDCHAYPTSDNCIPCVHWSLRADPKRAPHIPQLPEFQDAGITQEKSKPTTLVKIAAFDEHIIGLTNKGHVLKFDLTHAYRAGMTMRRQYVGYPPSASGSG
jgi:SCF-associated factor 1